MKIAIVEDQAFEQETLNSYLKEACVKRQIPLEVTCFNDGIAIVSNYDFAYDVIYLDVEMAILDGMATARKIRERDKEVLIVFVTNHSQVAIQGYSVEAVDFLLKPLTAFVFEEHFKKILRKLPQEEKKALYIRHKGQTTKIQPEDITYIENEAHTIYLHHVDGGVTQTSGTMKQMEALLEGQPFFRSNSCYIVNLAHIERVEGNNAYISGIPLQVSRPRKKAFLAALTNYIGDELL